MARTIQVLVLLLLLFIEYCLCDHANFPQQDDKLKISKPEILQKLDKASYSFNGFQKIASVPVLFPLDICLFDLKHVTYAAALHINKNGVRHFAVYVNVNDRFNLINERSTPFAITLDCQSFNNKGYAALAFNISAPISKAKDGSPVYEISGYTVRAIQYFSTPNVSSILLLRNAEYLYMLQILKNTASLPSLQCPYLIWEGVSFNPIGSIPCTNAPHLETFSITDDIYVAVANYADQYGRTATDSEIYKFDRQKHRFELFQQIRTYGAVHAKYFHVPFGEGKEQEHFLIFGNSISSEVSSTTESNADPQNFEANSIIYNFDKGQFIPYQKLSFYNVEQFLPIESSVTEKFLLLVACNNQDIKIFNLNDWTFEESHIQFTEGAFGKGVSRMRVFRKQGKSYLVVANQFMLASETNIFMPIFQQDEKANHLRQEIIEWSKRNTKRLASMDIEKLKLDVERKLAWYLQQEKHTNIREIPRSNIKYAQTNSLIYPHLRIGSGYWEALMYAKQAVDVLEGKLERSTVRLRRSLEDSSITGSEGFELATKRLYVRTLLVKDKLEARKINGFETTLGILDNITANKVIIVGKYESQNSYNDTFLYFPKTSEEMEETINVDDLHLTGKLNGITWDDLVNNTLKRQGPVQFLKAPINLKNFTINAVTVTSNEINGRNVAKLISTNAEGSYVVNQDVTFSAPVKAKNFKIHNRLNNIHVYTDQLDVLLSNSNKTQVITGAKKFDRIRVLKPVTISGRAHEKHFLAVTPIQAMPDNLILNGDYIIEGDVTISKSLKTTDIIDFSTNLSSKVIFQKGIRIDEPLENVDISFRHPIVANNSIVSFINAQDLQQLVKTNIKDVQVVEGEKSFKGSLEIKEGYGEVKILNGSSVEDLEKRLFLRNVDQTITAPMHFGKVISKSITSPQLSLSSHDLTDYLTLSGAQQIRGALKVGILTASTLIAQDLHTNGKIFGKELAEIYQKKAKSAPHPNIFQKGRKFRGSIYVHNLKLNSTINGKLVEEFEKQLRQLNGDIKYVGDLKFNYDMRISNMTFYGKFNGIPAKEFGQSWLQRNGEQYFTAPQTISSVESKSGIFLQGKLNGYRVEDFLQNTYWINRNEYITRAIFESPIQIEGVLFSSSFNYVFIPQDVIYRSSARPQILTHPVTVKGSIIVQGEIRNTTSINGLNLLALENYMNGYGWDTLYVQHALFAQPPQYARLNGYDLQATLETVWLANENIELQQHVEISNGHFEGLLEFQGPINNVNLKYLKENYFSLSRPQTISVPIEFLNATKFQAVLNANDMQLLGRITESKSEYHFFFDDFVKHTLKVAGSHTITGHWTMPEATVLGDLHNALINKLNLVTDVVRLDVPLNEVTATKHINTANIKKLYATPTTQVNMVNMAGWIKDSVFVYENHTILGTTLMDVVYIYNDVHVDGSVNGVTFDKQSLLLRQGKQILSGPVRIRNKFPAEQRILTNNIEVLWADTVNGWSVADFYANNAKLGPMAFVRGSLVFVNPLQASQYHVSEGNADAQREKRAPNFCVGYKSAATLPKLEKTVQALDKTYSRQNYILDDFEIRQILSVNATKVIALPLRLKQNFVDVIVIALQVPREENPLLFYSWNVEEQQFKFNQSFTWLPKDQNQLDIYSLVLKGDILDETGKREEFIKYESLIANDTRSLEWLFQAIRNKSNKVEPYKMNSGICLALYSCENVNVSLQCIRKTDEILKSSINRTHVKQILALSTDMIAILNANELEIWNTSLTSQPIQRLLLPRPSRLATVFKDKASYLAVISDAENNSLRHGSVEIYRKRNSLYTQMQTINCTRPLQAEFAVIPQSSDLLLYILSESYDHPMAVYNYKGTAGFVQIVATSILRKAFHMEVIQLTSTQKHLIALLSENQITFVEVLLKKV